MTVATVPTVIARRKQRQEELREKLKGLEYIRQLELIDVKLQGETLSRAELEQLKIRIDLNMRRLAKVLPDERFTEIELNVSNHEQALQELENSIRTGSEGSPDSEG